MLKDDHISASQVDSSLSGHVDPRDKEHLTEMVVDKPPKLVRSRRAFFSPEGRKWPKGEYNYVFDRQLTQQNRNWLLQAYREIGNKVPCVKFKPANSGSRYYIIHTSASSGCFATSLGYTPGRQTLVNVQSFCDYPTTMHEIFHALGAIHTQSRPDRDNYVDINWDNIKPSAMNNFKKAYGRKTKEDSEYDYKSTMHYPAYTGHAINRNILSIRSKSRTKKLKTYGHYKFSEQDYESLRTWYGCPKNKKNTPKNKKNNPKNKKNTPKYRKMKSSRRSRRPKNKKSTPKNKKNTPKYRKIKSSRRSRRPKNKKSKKMKSSSRSRRPKNKKMKSSSRSHRPKQWKGAIMDEAKSVDCRLSPWSDWTSCTAGFQSKKRTIEEEAKGRGLSCPIHTVNRRLCIRSNFKRSVEQEEEGAEKHLQEELDGNAVTHLKKTVEVVEGNPIVLVVSNPKNLTVEWFLVHGGEEKQILVDSKEFGISRTSAGNDRLTINESSVTEDDERLFVTKIYMSNTLLRVAWNIHVKSEDEYLSAHEDLSEDEDLSDDEIQN